MEERLNELPKGWARARIIDLVGKEGIFIDGDWIETKDQDPNGDARLIQLADIGDGFYRNKSNRFLTKEKAIQLNCTFLQPNDVLIARMPDPLGRACIFPGDAKPCITAVDVCIVRPSSRIANNRWLMHAVNAVQFRDGIESLQSGSTRKRISRSNLATLFLPLPPLPEQHRIVSKIEELFTKLDAGIEALKKIKAQLKRYRQAVLKYAFEGKLTQEWREAHKEELEPASILLERIKEQQKKEAKGKVKELPLVDTSELSELPEGWEWTRVGEVAFVISGQTPKDLDNHGSDGEIPFYKVNDMNRPGNEIFMGESAIFLNMDDVKRLKIHIQKDGTIIFPKRGGAIATNKKRILLKPASYDLNIMGVYPLIIPYKYFYHWISSVDLNILADGSNVPQINHNDVIPLHFPLPPLQEQHKVIEEIESRLSIADNLEIVAEQSLKQSDRVRQSILKQAFEGKLVPQDPTDEPAEKLLERIREEKTKRETENKKEKKHRSKNPKQMELI